MGLLDVTGWEILLYIAGMLVIWTSMRFLATSLYNSMGSLFEGPIKVNPFVNGVKYAVSYWTERGGRPYQEDRHQEFSTINSSLYGVFDGHGGYKAAQFCKEKMLQTIVKEAEFEKNPAQSMFNAFYKVDKEFSARARSQMLSDGSTAIVSVIQGGKIFIGNAGDCRAVVVQKGGRVKVMSQDHRPDRPDEENRVKKLGGKVIHWGRWRVEGVLAVSRAIGDVTLQPYITCEPEITEKVIEPIDEYLVLATDGIWDVMSNEDVAKLVLQNSKDFINISKTLCSEAMVLGSTDNLTALVIDLKNRITPESLAKQKDAK